MHIQVYYLDSKHTLGVLKRSNQNVENFIWGSSICESPQGILRDENCSEKPES